MKLVWQRLIRFETPDGRILRGEPILPSPEFDIGLAEASDLLHAKVISGGDIFATDGTTVVTDEIVPVNRVLGPLTQEDVPILRCVGLNYAKHVKESGRPPPPLPSIFFKPNTCITDHNAPVQVPRLVQDDQVDYEGELCFVLGEDAKDVKKEAAHNYIAAYTVGNDISARKYQRDPTLAGPVPQWGFSKGFDTFAPLGPCLVAGSCIQDPSQLRLTTKINDEIRQSEGIRDLIFDCAYLLEFLSQGTTLQKGSVIMTGTPGGIGGAMNPPQYLVPGTRMEVSISHIGTLRNNVVFA